MADEGDYRAGDRKALRVLFCFGVMPAFFDTPRSEVPAIVATIKEAFDDLAGRFGVTVLGTMDDDELMVGPSLAWPWTAYVLADAPDLTSVTAVCNLLRETPVGDFGLWRYMRVEAKVGRPLFFAHA
jgi:hypothetical protein